MHSMTPAPCPVCGDLDGCHLQSRLARLRSAVEAYRAECKSYARVLPKIVCLCGSTRFMEAWQAANLSETLAGNIVLAVGCNTKSDADLQRLGRLTPEKKAELDELHLHKIDLADEVLVLNCKTLTCCECHQPCFSESRGPFNSLSRCCDGNVAMTPYVGDSTRREIEHATRTGKPIRYLVPPT